MMNEQEYLGLLRLCINSDRVPNRTGIDTLQSPPGQQLKLDLHGNKLPLLTTKKMNYRAAFVELIWMLRGHSTTEFLHENGVHIWDSWATEDGELGPIYGTQWRSFGGRKGGKDQIVALERGLAADPHSRRHLVSAWDPNSLELQALPPCPFAFQFIVDSRNRLNCVVYQRSADVFLGVPFDMLEFATLTIILAQLHNFAPGTLTMQFGDLHIYVNHIYPAALQLTRDTLTPAHLAVNDKLDSITSLELDDLTVVNYNHHDPIVAKVAV